MDLTDDNSPPTPPPPVKAFVTLTPQRVLHRGALNLSQKFLDKIVRLPYSTEDVGDLTVHDMLSLNTKHARPGFAVGWVNNAVIHTYLHLLRPHSDPSLMYFPSYLDMTRLRVGQLPLKPFPKCKYYAFVIWEGDTHWRVEVLSSGKKPKIYVLDSMISSDDDVDSCMHRFFPSSSEIQDPVIQLVHKAKPTFIPTAMQQNPIDCGVFTCFFARTLALARNIPSLMRLFLNRTVDSTEFRFQMCEEILSGRLRGQTVFPLLAKPQGKYLRYIGGRI